MALGERGVESAVLRFGDGTSQMIPPSAFTSAPVTVLSLSDG